MGGSMDGLRQKQVDKVIGSIKALDDDNWEKEPCCVIIFSDFYQPAMLL